MAAKVAVGVSGQADSLDAFAAASAEAAAGLGGECDLAIAFAAAPHLGRSEELLAAVHEALGPRRLIGCGAGGVLGDGRELEQGPGAVVWALRAPGARIEVHHVRTEAANGAIEITGLPAEGLGEAVIALADPFTLHVDALLAAFDQFAPGVPVVGGLASAAGPDAGSLLLDDAVLAGGAVLCTIDGAGILPCVSQGARPIGPEMTVTAADGNLICELASRPAVERLREALAELDPAERELAAGGLLLGLVIDENQPEYGRGDFLVRPIAGVEPRSGTLALGQPVRVGQTVRMHVRDAASADEDLRDALRLEAAALGDGGAAGALLFTCNGRGSHMFDVPDHDAAAVADALGAPVGGFFCAGEIGPVGGRNFLHGFTATLAVFPREPPGP